jgi:RNA polymerase sigma-70 factor (ECF subfamily)
MVDLNDEALIQKIRSGSQPAYGGLIERYERLVVKIVLSYTRNLEDAFDVSQEVFFKVYQKLDMYTGTGSFKGWLIRIIHNECVSWLRKQKRLGDFEELSPDNTPSHPADQESGLVKSERAQMLQNEILRLNPTQQMAVTLRYFEGMPIREIAEVLECSDGNVKSILFRSLDKMRKRLDPQRREKP